MEQQTFNVHDIHTLRCMIAEGAIPLIEKELTTYKEDRESLYQTILSIGLICDTYHKAMQTGNSVECAALKEKCCKEEKEKYEMAIEAICDIKEKVWEIDIPSPTTPENIEHHEQVKSVLKVIYAWITKLGMEE